MFRRWRHPRSITALVMVLSLVASVPGAARADSAADQKKKVEQLAAELTNLNERIAVLDEHYGAALDKKTEIDAMLARIQALSDAHFNADPETLHWGHVGDLDYYAELLKRITDSAFKEGEHAE
mgnify:CR=1 FL=1